MVTTAITPSELMIAGGPQAARSIPRISAPSIHEHCGVCYPDLVGDVPERERFRISARRDLGVDRLPAAAETRRPVYDNAISTAEIASASAAFFMNETIPWVLLG
jgi:hypothetical protein